MSDREEDFPRPALCYPLRATRFIGTDGRFLDVCVADRYDRVVCEIRTTDMTEEERVGMACQIADALNRLKEAAGRGGIMSERRPFRR